MDKKYCSLLEFSTNVDGKIYEINTCKSVKQRLYSIGMQEGSEIKKIIQSFGPMLIKTKETKLIIGKNLADKIIVQY